MNEEEFDSLMRSRPYGTEDARRAEDQMLRDLRLSATLGVALWGKTLTDLQRRLLEPHPEIPSGFDLPDFRVLLHISGQMVLASVAAYKIMGLAPSLASAPTIFVGTQGFTVWEARYEVVRRAIEYLEQR